MKRYKVQIALFLALFLLSARVSSSSRLIDQGHGCHHSTRACKTVEDVKPMVESETFVTMKQRKPDTLEIAGSGLPDCSHACGACRPCRLVMVSFICATIEEAETCPMAYKCMCRERAFPVP